MMRPFQARPALIVVDVQKAFDEIEAAGAARNNSHALEQIVRLMTAFRKAGAPLIHVRHASRDPRSPFRTDCPGYAVKDEVREWPGESVIVKHVNSAFVGTDLERRLRDLAVTTLVLVGATTNHCVETTARMGANLGFDVRLVEDATWTFDRTGPHGDRYGAEEIHRMTLANLHDEFAEIVLTRDIIRELESTHAAAHAS